MPPEAIEPIGERVARLEERMADLKDGLADINRSLTANTSALTGLQAAAERRTVLMHAAGWLAEILKVALGAAIGAAAAPWLSPFRH